MTPDIARDVARAFDGIDAPGEVERLGTGLLHDTFALRSGGEGFVLQRVHPVFPPEVHLDIAAVTIHLADKGIATPRLVPTRDGALWWSSQEADVWRLMTRLPGHSHDAITGPRQAEQAGRALAEFHRALADLEHGFVSTRGGVHDTPAHLQNLRRALAECPEHPLHPGVAELAERLFEAAEQLPGLDDVPRRVVHGDPKFNNLLFASLPGGGERVLGWIDLDTVGPMALHHELGDAWRSWCNGVGEDATTACFDLDVFAASLRGYAAVRPFALTPSERTAQVYGVEWITLELAARFAADALFETYFGWDPSRFDSRGQHNLVRARGQWSLHERARACREARRALVEHAWG